ncbi:MAG: CHAD domain-containing protein [Haliangiales bacterium]
MIDACARISDYASQQDAAADPKRAVHEFRKAVRRLRALLRLMEGFVGVDAYERARETLRELHQATSAWRDRHVVNDILAGLEQLDTNAKSAAVIESLRASIAIQPLPEPAVIQPVLDQGCAELAELPSILAGAMPRQLRWQALDNGLATCYRRARRRWRDVTRHDDSDAIHELRKRVKEVTYQIELFSELGGGRIQRQRKRFANLSERLGQVSDLIVLRSYIEEHAKPNAERRRLLKAVATAQTQHTKRALKLADRLFEDSPREYARAIVRAARKRRPS